MTLAIDGLTAGQVPTAGGDDVALQWGQAVQDDIRYLDVRCGLGKDPATSTGLTYGYKAGYTDDGTTITDKVAGTLALANNATNYIEVDLATAVISANAVGWTAGLGHLAQQVTLAGAQTTYTDRRFSIGGGGGSSAGLKIDSFTATALQTNFGLSWTPGAVGDLILFLDGTQIVSGYTPSLVGATLTLAPGLPLNSKLTVIGAEALVAPITDADTLEGNAAAYFGTAAAVAAAQADATTALGDAAAAQADATQALADAAATAPDWYTWDGRNNRTIADLNYEFGGLTTSTAILTGNAASPPVMVALDSTRVFIMYPVLGGKKVVIANVGVVSCTFGTPQTTTATLAYAARFVKIDTDKVAAVYSDGAALKAVVFTISGNTITEGTAAALGVSSAQNDTISICELGTDRVGVAAAASQVLKCVAFSVSGTTVTAGAVVNVGHNSGYFQIAKLATGLFIAGGEDATGNVAKFYVGTVTVNTISLGASNTLAVERGTGKASSLTVFSATSALWSGTSSGNDTAWTQLTISGNTVSAGTQSADTDNLQAVSVVNVVGTACLFAGRKSDNLNHMLVGLVRLDASFGYPIVSQYLYEGIPDIYTGDTDSTAFQTIPLVVLDSTKVLMLYMRRVNPTNTGLVIKLRLIQR